MRNQKIYFLLTHPKGIGTYNFRIFSFVKKLVERNKEIYILSFKYPFKSFYEFGEEVLGFENLYRNLSVKYNFIQILVGFMQTFGIHPFFQRILYALNIIIYKKDLWYVSLSKSSYFKKRELDYDVFVASGGPGSVLDMAYEISIQNPKTILFLDYRDPWNLGYNLLGTSSAIHRFKSQFMRKRELKILERANHITVVSESLKNFFPKDIQLKTTVIQNGSNYNQDYILPLINPKPIIFNLIYVGTIYNEQLEDETFFQAFSIFKKNLGNTKEISLKFIGSKRNRKLVSILEKYNLLDVTEILDRVGSKELLPYLLNASMFLHLRYAKNSKIITTKNSDYLLFRKPILLPVSDNGDLSESILKQKSGYICNSVESNVAVLLKEFKKNETNLSIIINLDKDLSYLTREKLAEDFSCLLNKVIGEFTPPNP